MPKYTRFIETEGSITVHNLVYKQIKYLFINIKRLGKID